MTNYPKVLIVGQPFNRTTGGGITLSNLFKGWKKENLAVVCSAYLLDKNVTFDIADNYYQLGKMEFCWRFPFSLFKRKYYSGPLSKPNEEKFGSIEEMKVSNLRTKLIMDYFYPFLEFVGLNQNSSYPILSPKLINWIMDFQPDLIYAQATSRNGLLFCKLLQNEFNYTPFIFHMMDDWPSMISEVGGFRKYWHKKIDLEFREVLDQSSNCLSISEYMSEDYLNRYGIRFTPFHNPINLEFWKSRSRVNYDLADKPTLLYAGRLGLGIDTSIERIAQAVQFINEEDGIEMSFILQTQTCPEWVKIYPCVVHNSFVDYDELPRVFAESDFLVLPYDFESKSAAFIKYSMPTKASEYFASGTPVLVFSPEETALVKYVRKYDCAAVVNQNKVSELVATLKRFLKDRNYRETLGTKAKRVVEEFHRDDKVREDFLHIVQSSLR